MNILLIGNPHSEQALQNDTAVLHVLGMQGIQIMRSETRSTEPLQTQLQAINPQQIAAIKISAQVDKSLIAIIVDYLNALGEQCPPIVLNPATAAHWISRPLLPKTTLLPLHLTELSQLSGMPISDFASQHAAVESLLERGISAVLVKEGYSHATTPAYYDYFCQAGEHFWLSNPYWCNRNTVQGTEHLLALAATAALAQGYAMNDAVVLAAALSTHGIRAAQSYQGVLQTYLPTTAPQQTWPFTREDIPHLYYQAALPITQRISRCETTELGIYPVVDSLAWLKKLVPLGIQTIQLRIKADTPSALHSLENTLYEAIQYCRAHRVRLFINDHWQLAIQYQAYGIHLGQEDLATADLQAIANSGCKLGVSTHCYTEVARALAVDPSYIALGPIFATTSKQMPWIPQGIAAVANWVRLLGDEYPLVAIGGIDKDRAQALKATGVGSVAMISAITQAEDYQAMTRQLIALWE